MSRKPKKIGDINLSTLLTLTNIAILIFALILTSFIYYALVIILELIISTPYTLMTSYASFVLHRIILLAVLITWIIIYGRE